MLAAVVGAAQLDVLVPRAVDRDVVPGEESADELTAAADGLVGAAGAGLLAAPVVEPDGE